jgi:hypothetical protein
LVKPHQPHSLPKRIWVPGCTLQKRHFIIGTRAPHNAESPLDDRRVAELQTGVGVAVGQGDDDEPQITAHRIEGVGGIIVVVYDRDAVGDGEGSVTARGKNFSEDGTERERAVFYWGRSQPLSKPVPFPGAAMGELCDLCWSEKARVGIDSFDKSEDGIRLGHGVNVDWRRVRDDGGGRSDLYLYRGTLGRNLIGSKGILCCRKSPMRVLHIRALRYGMRVFKHLVGSGKKPQASGLRSNHVRRWRVHSVRRFQVPSPAVKD